VFTFSVADLRRRPAGPKLLVYLDQSTLSFLTRPEGRDLRAALDKGVRADRLHCPSSLEHADESVLAAPVHEQLHTLLDELSMGIGFLPDEHIRVNEIVNAAASFSGERLIAEPWAEAFFKDPHTPRQKLYPGGFRISLAAQRLDWHIAEVEREKDGCAELSAAYDNIRAAPGATFKNQASLEYVAAVKARLPFLCDPVYASRQLEELRTAAAAEPPNTDPSRIFGPEMSRFHNAMRTRDFCEMLVKRFPTVWARRFDFLGSATLRTCPSLVYPSLFYAGVALTLGRKAHASDRYDYSHLMKGLSRCDIVTADPGMAQMCRERGLVPPDVQLFSSREHSALLDYIEAHRVQHSNAGPEAK
jgi:hypothetical protein